ncbi:MAG: HU family DNA-binding protein [Prevotellaceae bacterium]|jgi:predicted histone-like DNA-binding protein|nr:HU family DNA-binding protein [Prevotellaceae bacterium]
MAVNHVIVLYGNPPNPRVPKRFYTQTKSGLTFRKLSKEIAEGSITMSDNDVLTVLNDQAKVLKRYLSNGEIVRFDNFGTFQVAIASEGAEMAEKFKASLIKSGKVTFRTGIDLKEMLAALIYKNGKITPFRATPKRQQAWGSREMGKSS